MVTETSKRLLAVMAAIISTIVLTACGTSSATISDAEVAAKASERWHAWRQSRPAFPIAAWSYFQRYEGTAVEFRTYAGAGLNMVQIPQSQFEAASQAGCGGLLGAWEKLFLPENSAALKAAVEFPQAANGGVWGYVLFDEPSPKEFAELGKAHEFIYTHDRRNALPIVDMFPSYAVPATRFGLTYEEYMNAFLTQVKPAVLLNCHYPIVWSNPGGPKRNNQLREFAFENVMRSIREDYYYNNELFRKLALEHDIGFMGFVLVTGHFATYRIPSESELRWQVFTHLAYGAQGIWYYNYRIQPNDKFGEGIVLHETGKPGPVYDLVKRVNADVQALGLTLMKLKSVDVFHTGREVPLETKRYTDGCIPGLSSLAGEDLIVGSFRNQDDGSDEDLYLFIVNKRNAPAPEPRGLANRIAFAIGGEYSCVYRYSPKTGKPERMPCTEGLYALELAGGNGALLRLAKSPLTQEDELESAPAMPAKGQQDMTQNDKQDVEAILNKEIQRSKSDYVVYTPGSLDGSTFDTGNEHFLVFDGPDGSLMCVWTQSSYEGAGDHRIVFARSDDEGKTWTPPKHLVGPKKPGDGYMASWGFPITSKSGRIYVIYNQYHGIDDVVHQHTGTMDCLYSDDMGKTWSHPQNIPMKRSPHDHTDPSVPSCWIVWQKPIKDLQGKWFTGFSRWVSRAVRTPPHVNSWTAWETVVEFMRFENIDENPEPKDIKISYSAWGDQALRVPHYTNPLLSIAQEPSIVRLPDKRLFCTMRTMAGCIWYSVSDDDGRTWCAPRPMLRKDFGLPVLEPLCCCPIYEYSEGRYVLLHHNNDGRVDGHTAEETHFNRHPAFIALGEFRPDAEQPIWFSESKQLMDNDGQGIGPLSRLDIGVYPSVTNRKGNYILWHPDRKFFLLGKKITEEWLSDLEVPR